MELNNILKGLADVNTENRIIGYLMKEPSYILEPEFPLSFDDFTNRRNKLVFSVLSNAISNGEVEELSPSFIDAELRRYPMQYEEYEKAGGYSDLLSLTLDEGQMADRTTFNILYQRIKKFSLLRDMERAGFSTHDIYNNDAFDNTSLKEKFDDCSMEDFMKIYKTKLNDIEEKYHNKNVERGIKAAEGIKDLIEKYKTTPSRGVDLDGELYNYAVRGARLGKMVISSSPSGHGKTRRMVGQVCALTMPYLDKNGNIVLKDEYYPALFISTEQSTEEIQTLVLAYVSNVDEGKIIDGLVDCSSDEIDRINKGIEIMEKFNDNLYLEQIADPSIGVLKSKALQYIYKNGVQYLFFDYIFTGTGLLSEFSAARIREDVILLQMSNALKEIATVNEVFVMSATQVSGDYEKPGFRGAGFIRGSKAIADKVDAGDITMRLLPQEEEEVSETIASLGCIFKPNIVTDIYKNRSGALTQVKIFSYFDFGTCHLENLFMTDMSYNAMTVDRLYKEEKQVIPYDEYKEERSKVLSYDEII